MVFNAVRADTEVMDAFELTRPILSPSRHLTRTDPDRITPSRRRKVHDDDVLVDARRYVNQLPLGTWAGPPFDRPRWSPQAASREVERSLFRTAAAHGVTVSVDDAAEDIARRLVRCRVIVAPAADAAVALLQVLRSSPDDAGDAGRLADRLVGYLDHRTMLKPMRLWR
jgi:hypothetical protein